MDVERLLQRGLKLRKTVRCVNCWRSFASQDVLWISEHGDLLGDRLLGDEERRRFRAVRFTVQGDALDQRGAICTEIACPECHLPIPRILLRHRPLFASIIGSPSCGKSYYLGALVNRLRKLLPAYFCLDFFDADHISNQVINDYEQALFMQPDPSQYLRLQDLIEKTQLQGRLYNRVTVGSQQVLFPRPFSFSLQPRSGHPHAEKARAISRAVCLYDNAGEHFLPGQDSSTAPATRHLAISDFVLFLFDPLQDPRFLQSLVAPEDDPERYRKRMKRNRKPVRQEIVLHECDNRIQRHRRGADASDKGRPPLIIIVTKFDEWHHLLPDVVWEDQYSVRSNGVRGLNLGAVHRNSKCLEALLRRIVPELAYAAERFSDDVVYVPVSALGVRPRLDDEGFAYVKPSSLNPQLVELPFLYGLSRSTQGLILAKQSFQ